MKEDEVIEKLEFFKKAIIELKNEKEEYKEKAENLLASSASEEREKNATISEIEEKYNALSEENKTLKEQLKQLEETSKKEVEEEKAKYDDLKEKTYYTIKHLVEDVIEPKEKEIEEITKRVSDLEKLLFQKNKDSKMIVKSAEKELSEMIAGK